MAKDENGLNLTFATDSAEADDDVVDLLEVVKPGKAASQQSDKDEDFSADLEAMFETLSREEQAKAVEETLPSFPDPTPVDHVVDLDESLDMPGMDDLDHILSSLGASAQTPSSENASRSAADWLDPSLPAADMPDLDAVPVAKNAVPLSHSSSDRDLFASDIEKTFSASPAKAATLPPATPVDLEGLPPVVGGAPEFSSPAEAADLPGMAEEIPLEGPATAPAASTRPDFSLSLTEPGEDDADKCFMKSGAEVSAEDKTMQSPAEAEFEIAFEAAGTIDEALLAALPDRDRAPEPSEEAAAPPAPPAPGPLDLAAVLMPDPSASEKTVVGSDTVELPEMNQPYAEDSLSAALNTTVSDIASESLKMEHRHELKEMTAPGIAGHTPEETAGAPGHAPQETAGSGVVAQNMATAGVTGHAPQDMPGLPENHAEITMEQKTNIEDAPVSTQASEPIEGGLLTSFADSPREASPGSGFDEVDLNELDALLDDMLASAPASGPARGAPPAAENGPEMQEENASDAPAAGDAGALPAPGSELASLRLDMDALRRDLAAVRQAQHDHAAPIAPGIEVSIEDMKLTLQNLDNRLQAMECRLNELCLNIDKYAAEAAAKIIREELAVLLEAGI